GIDQIVKRRLGQKVIGCGADSDQETDLEKEELLTKILPEDLHSYGLIPEFIARLPVIASLQPLDVYTLVEILTKPKNALVKQYMKVVEIDDVELEFEEAGVEAIAKRAIERTSGGRGLRSIIENIMLEVMFELPSREDIQKCISTKETV